MPCPFFEIITVSRNTPDYRWTVPFYWTLISVYVFKSMESTFPTVFWTTLLIITFCMFIHVQSTLMNACANCNQAWRIFLARWEWIVSEMLRPVAVLSCDIYSFLGTKDWISGNYSFLSVKHFFFSVYWIMAVRCCAWKEMKSISQLIFIFSFNFDTFTGII